MHIAARHALLSLAAVAAVVTFVGCATEATPQATQDRLSSVDKTLNDFQADPEMKWFRDNLGKARAVIVSPQITRAGFIVGGSGGPAVAYARDAATGKWSGPAFFSMGTGSIGFLAGVDFSEAVILLMNQKAVDGLASSSFKFGGNASIAAGPVGVGATGDIGADMVSFMRSKGVYAGASLDGAVLTPDTQANQSFYGRAALPADILIRQSVTSTAPVPKVLASIGPGSAPGSSTGASKPTK